MKIDCPDGSLKIREDKWLKYYDSPNISPEDAKYAQSDQFVTKSGRICTK